MRNYKETDKIIKDKLEHYDSGVPMHLFDGIEKGLDSDDKKPGGFWLWSLGLLILMVGSTSWYVLSNNNNTKVVSAKVITNDLQIDNLQTEKVVIADKTTAVQKINISQSSPKKITQGLTSKLPVSKKVTVDKTIENSTIDFINASNTISKQEQLANVQQPSSHHDFSSKGSDELETSERKPILTSTTIEKKEELVFGQNIPTLSDLSVASNAKFKMPDIVKCGNKKDRSLNLNFKTSMDLFVSPERSFRFLEYKSNDYADYAAKRNETEKAYYSFSSGLRFNFLADNGLAVRTGLVYSQINEIFEVQLLETHIVQDPVTGDILGYSQYLNDVTTFNRYKMVDVPLLIGYEMPMKRSTINVNAGIYANITAMQKGKLLSPDLEQQKDFTTGSGDYEVFRKNIGISYFMSLGAAYEISPRYQFFFEPNLRYYPGSFTKKEYVLNQKYVTGGIILGIRKKM